MLFGTVTMLGSSQPKKCSIPAVTRNLSLYQTDHIGYETYPASYSVATGRSFAGGKAAEA